ncbi:hypothetical protein ACFOQM_13235 [Paenibacillus sp. GCM10012307]|uniref:Uncharacterized protein n=1 Tax=Paenibacillus roseus TaxID=2798579 RepID=A0A934MRE0_9BACL|nr:hypothetical protein [Paenibacillus roseus]MBJ6362259.1 hypothetical protein [Paenibacillus roseus]
MKKVLEVMFPPITTYMTHASVLSVVMQHEQGIKWLLDNYLQLSVVDSGGIDFLGLEPPLNCPILHYQIMDHELVDHLFKDPVQFIIHAINQDYYLFLLLETSQIQAANTNVPRPHPVFIYGYCEETETFHIGEFFDFNNFSFMTASFEEIRSGWLNYAGYDYWFKGNRLFKYSYKDDYAPEYERLVTMIEDYATSQNTILGFHNFNSRLSFGLDAIANRLQLELTRFGNGEHFDRVAFPIICDHKEVMLLAIEQLEQKGYLDRTFPSTFHAEYECLKKKLLMLRNKYLKIAINGKYHRVEALQLEVGQWFEQEKNLLMKIIENCKARFPLQPPINTGIGL